MRVSLQNQTSIPNRTLKRLGALLLTTFLLGIPVLFKPAWAAALGPSLASFATAIQRSVETSPGTDTARDSPTAPTVVAASTAYVYDLDTTITGTMASTTETGSSDSRDVASRLKSKVRLTPSPVSGEYFLQLDEPLELQGTDVSGGLVSQPIKTEIRDALKRATKVQQGADGTVLGIQFPATYPGLATEDVEGVKNALRGVASLFDYRLIQPNTSMDTVAEDSSGKYQAHFERGADGLILRKKLGYTEYAPGAGLYDISDGSQKPIASTLAHTGETRIQLDGSNHILSVNLMDSLRMQNAGAPSPSGEFAVNGTNQLQANLVFNSAALTSYASSSKLNQETSWGPMESLHAEVGCHPTPSSPQSATDLSEALSALAELPNPLGEGIHLSRAMREAGEIQAAVDWLKSGRLSPQARKEVVFALGMVGSSDAQEILLQVLMDPADANEVRAQALLSLQAQAHPSKTLLAGLEHYAFRSAGAPQDMAKFALASLVGKLGQDEAQFTNRILNELGARFLQSKDEGEKRILVAALGASRRDTALSFLELALEDSSPSVQQAAALTLQAFPGPHAEQLLTRAARMNPRLAPPRAATAAASDVPGGSSRDCADMAQRLGYDPTQDKFNCHSWNLNAGGDLGFLGAYGRLTAGAGAGGRWDSGFYADARVDGGLFFKVIGIELKVLEFWAQAGFHTQDPSRRRFGMDYAWFGVNFPAVDWNDWSGKTGAVDLGGRGKGYQWCGPIGPFWWCLEVGIKLDYGIEQGKTPKAVVDEAIKVPPNFDELKQASEQRAIYWMIAPYGKITAYVEGRVSFACLRVRARLQGSFLIHKYPTRLVLDFHDVLHSNDLGLLDTFLLIDEYRRPWQLDLIGTFDYCIGSTSKVLWTKGGPESNRRLLTLGFNKCDFAIKDFSWSVEKPSEATPLEFSVSATNLGPSSTSPFTPLKARLFVDGTKVKESIFKDGNDHPVRMFPYKDASTKITWDNPTQGNHTLTIKLDEDGDLADVNRNNQALSKSIYIHPRLYDFTIQEVHATPLASGNIKLEIVSDNIGSKQNINICPPMRCQELMWVITYDVYPRLRVFYRGRTIADASAFRGLVYPANGDPVSKIVKISATCSVEIPSVIDGVNINDVDITIDPDNQYEEVSKLNNSILGFKLGNTVQDTQPPVLSNLAVGGSVGQIPLSVAVTDNVGIAKVEFYVDGSLRATVPAAQPYPTSQTFTTTFNSSLVPDGAHSLYAKAYDTTGNAATTPSLSFNVQNALDQEPPVVTQAREDGTGGNISFTATATDNVAVRRLDFLIDDQVVGSLASASGTIWKDSTAYPDGPHTFYARAFDAANNSGVSNPITFTLSNDSEPPSASASVNGGSGTIALSAYATDNKGVSKVEFYVDNMLRATAPANQPYPTASNFSAGFDSTQSTNGSHILVAKAFDAAGNIGTSPSVSFNVQNGGGDTTPPTLSYLRVIKLRSGFEIIGFRLSVNARDNVAVDRVDFYIGSDWVGAATAAPYSVDIGPDYTGSGYLPVRAVATDTSGNTNEITINYRF